MIAACTPPTICAAKPPAHIRTVKRPACPRGGWTVYRGVRIRWVVDCKR